MSGLPKIPVAISSCLLGELVRYDGKTKKATWVMDALEDRVQWVSLCPEDGAGLGTPRPPIDIFMIDGERRLKTLDGSKDHTEVVQGYCEQNIDRFLERRVCGYVLKSRSPSCGIGDATIHGSAQGLGDGVMVHMVRHRLPNLPIIRDEDLWDSAQCERFIEAVSNYWRDHFSA